MLIVMLHSWSGLRTDPDVADYDAADYDAKAAEVQGHRNCTEVAPSRAVEGTTSV
jgi:hypothetical protein